MEKSEETSEKPPGALEWYKLRLGFWQAIWGTLISGGIAAALPAAIEAYKNHIEHVKILEESRLKEIELQIKDREANDKNISGFLSTALNQDIELRIRFAEYMSLVAGKEKKNDWKELYKILSARRQSIRAEIEDKEKQIAEINMKQEQLPRDKAKLTQLKRGLSWAYAEAGYAKLDANITALPTPAGSPNQFEVPGSELYKYLPSKSQEYSIKGLGMEDIYMYRQTIFLKQSLRDIALFT